MAARFARCPSGLAPDDPAFGGIGADEMFALAVALGARTWSPCWPSIDDPVDPVEAGARCIRGTV